MLYIIPKRARTIYLLPLCPEINGRYLLHVPLGAWLTDTDAGP